MTGTGYSGPGGGPSGGSGPSGGGGPGGGPSGGGGPSRAAGAGVFGDLVGQDAVVAELRSAAAAAAAVLRGEPNAGMTHAWLFTGPQACPAPGSSVTWSARSRSSRNCAGRPTRPARSCVASRIPG